MLLLVLASLALADTFRITEGSAGFHSIGRPSAIQIPGRDGQPKGEVKLGAKSIQGSIRVALAPITTGISLRDRHMKEKYLEIAKHPDAVLEIDWKEGPEELGHPAFELKDVELPAWFTAHGKTQAVRVKCSLSREGERLNGKGAFQLKVLDLGIELPTYLGFTMAETVDVSAEFSAALAK